jgi:4-hydroxybenzoate polyprenyltransferase
LYLYSLTKRFTHFTQIFLGLALSLAPLGATIAVLGRVTASSLILALAVLFWVAGFDLLYSLQDLQFDREHRVYSLPVKLGQRKTFWLSRSFHFVFFILLLIYGALVGFGMVYWAGCGLSAFFLLYQHLRLKSDLKQIQGAFFTANGLLSLFFLAFVLGDLYL